MKIKILEDRAIITDNVPIVIDFTQLCLITVDTPDNATYIFKFNGKHAKSQSVVDKGKVVIPQCFFTEQTLQVEVVRCSREEMTVLPCEPIKIYKLGNVETAKMYVDSAIGQDDVRERAAEAIQAVQDLTQEIHSLADSLAERTQELIDTKAELEALKTDLAAFKTLYNANTEIINDLIRRVEIMEADYDILVK